MNTPDQTLYRISVVIPTYNAAAYIGRAIRSVQCQTYPVHEILVVDDGSTDETERIVSEYSTGVTYIRQSNAGVAVARNKGIHAATGEWIAFLDADDEWLPDKLKKQVDLLRRNPELVWVYSNFYQCGCAGPDRRIAHVCKDRQSFSEDSESFDSYFSAWRNGFYMWTGTVLVRRDAIVEAGLFQPGLTKGEDSDMWYRLSYRWNRVGYLREPLSVYHVCIPTCATLTNNQTCHICRLIERNLKLSAAHNRYEDFLPVASMTLEIWIREILTENRINEIRYLLSRYGDLLPIRFRCEMYVRTTFPGLGSDWVDMIHRLKDRFRKPENRSL